MAYIEFEDREYGFENYETEEEVEDALSSFWDDYTEWGHSSTIFVLPRECPQII